jgi:hypothetical protein
VDFLIGIAVYLGVFGLTWWAVCIFVEPGPPKAPKRVREPRYIAPRETTEQHLLRGLSTILILEILFGRRDH